MNSSRVLVTGATGFIGQHLASRLLSMGNDVHLLVRERSDLSVLGADRERCTLHVFDGTYESAGRAVKESAPDTVFHLASLFLAQHSASDVQSLIRSNVEFGAYILEAMTECGVSRFVNTGTSWQNYNNAAYEPVNLYAATKEAFSDILAYYTAAKGLHAVTLKLFDTYGPGDTRKKLFTLLKKASETGEELQMSPGEQLLDIVYIDDVIDAFVQAIPLLDVSEPAASGYAVSSGNPITLRSVVEIFSAAVGRRVNVVWGGREYRPREVMVPWNSGPAVPGWAPKWSLEDGLRKTYAY